MKRSMKWSLVRRTRWCARTQLSHRCSWQSRQRELAALPSSQELQRGSPCRLWGRRSSSAAEPPPEEEEEDDDVEEGAAEAVAAGDEPAARCGGGGRPWWRLLPPPPPPPEPVAGPAPVARPFFCSSVAAATTTTSSRLLRRKLEEGSASMPEGSEITTFWSQMGQRSLSASPAPGCRCASRHWRQKACRQGRTWSRRGGPPQEELPPPPPEELEVCEEDEEVEELEERGAGEPHISLHSRQIWKSDSGNEAICDVPDPMGGKNVSPLPHKKV